MSESSNEPRLHVDSDWKAQAQAEKERLARQETERSAKGGGRGPQDLPPADFRSLVGILASQAMSGLGLYGDEKGRVIVDPIGAKFAIDLLGILEEKTKGNLSKEEAADIESVLRELRLRFVQVMDLIARQDIRAAAPGAGGAGGAGSAGSDIAASIGRGGRSGSAGASGAGDAGSSGPAGDAPAPASPRGAVPPQGEPKPPTGGGSRIIVP